MRAKHIRSLIVDRDDETDAFGIITYSDLVTKVFAKKLDPAKMSIGEITTKPLIVINPNLRVEYVAQTIRQDGHQPRASLFRTQAHWRHLQDRFGGELVLAHRAEGTIGPFGYFW